MSSTTLSTFWVSAHPLRSLFALAPAPDYPTCPPPAASGPCPLHSVSAYLSPCGYTFTYWSLLLHSEPLGGLYLCFSSCLLFSRSMGGLVPWTGITDRQYLCSWGQCRWSPCRHECGQTHDNAAAMSLGDQQTAQWFEMSQERDHTRLLGRNYLSANIKRHGLWLLLFNMVRRKRRDEVQWVEGRNKKWQKSRKAGSEHNSDEER